MANLDEEDVIEDDSFRAVLSFSPEVQEAIDQVLDGIILILVKVGVVFLYWNGRNIFVFFSKLSCRPQLAQVFHIIHNPNLDTANHNHTDQWSSLS